MHKRLSAAILAITLFLVAPVVSHAVPVFVDQGQTSVVLDFDVLATVAGLELSSISPDVIAPGNLGGGSVAFGINPRDAAAPALPTTFAYDSDDFLGTFSGVIEHTGSVFFNMDGVEVGNFTIGFDAARIGDDRSGFFVASTVGLAATLFDVATPSALSAGAEALDIAADLLVSNELGSFLVANDFAASDLTGAAVGSALVEAQPALANGVIPEPSTAILLAVGLCALARKREH